MLTRRVLRKDSKSCLSNDRTTPVSSLNFEPSICPRRRGTKAYVIGSREASVIGDPLSIAALLFELGEILEVRLDRAEEALTCYVDAYRADFSITERVVARLRGLQQGELCLEAMKALETVLRGNRRWEGALRRACPAP